MFGILCQILGCFFASYISWWVTNCQHDEWQMFTSQLSNWEPFLHDIQGKHVQNCLKQLGLWARTDQHITNHWIIIFLDIQPYLEVWCFMYAFGVHTFLGGVCACFFFELNSKKTCPNLAWLCFSQIFVHPKVELQPTADLSKVKACEFTQSHPGRIVALIVSRVKPHAIFLPLGRGRNPRSWGLTNSVIVPLTSYERSIQTGRKCWNAAKAAGNYKRNPESHPTNGDGSISDSCKWFTPT